jgi:hypothetical protein
MHHVHCAAPVRWWWLSMNFSLFSSPFFKANNSVIVSPNGTLDLDNSPTPSNNHLAPGLSYGYGRQGRRASRSLVDLYALASLQQRSAGHFQLANYKNKSTIHIKGTSKSMDDHCQQFPFSIQISCDSDDQQLSNSRQKLLDQSGGLAASEADHHHHPTTNNDLKSRLISECRSTRSFDRDMSTLDRASGLKQYEKLGQSTMALYKISTSPKSQFNSSADSASGEQNVSLTKGYLKAASRHLAASTLRLWQAGALPTAADHLSRQKRKTKSSYNLKDCV